MVLRTMKVSGAESSRELRKKEVWHGIASFCYKSYTEKVGFAHLQFPEFLIGFFGH